MKIYVGHSSSFDYKKYLPTSQSWKKIPQTE